MSKAGGISISNPFFFKYFYINDKSETKRIDDMQLMLIASNSFSPRPSHLPDTQKASRSNEKNNKKKNQA